MLFAVILFLYLLGIVIYRYKPRFIIYFLLLWNVFIPYIVSFIIIDMSSNYVISGQSNYFLILIFLVNAAKNNVFRKYRKALCYIVVIFFLICLCAIFNNVNLSYYIKWFISNIVPIYAIVTILSSLKIEKNSCLNFLYFLLIIQLIIGYIQYYTSYLISPLYLLTNSMGVINNRFWGSFSGENATAAFNSIIFFILLFNYKINKKKIVNVLFGCLFLIYYYSIIISGVRTYLILVTFFIPYLLYIKTNSRNIKASIVIVVSLTFFIISSTLLLNSYDNEGKAETTIERQLLGISKFKEDGMEETTLFYTNYILNNYYNPINIFGEGKLYSSYGYGLIRNDELTSASVTDATLAVYLVEFGIILFTIILFYLYYLTCNFFYCKEKKVNLFKKAIFVFLSMSTITDAGLFNLNNIILLSLYSYIVSQKNIHCQIN